MANNGMENNEDVIVQIINRIDQLNAEKRKCEREKKTFSYWSARELEVLQKLFNHAQILATSYAVREVYEQHIGSILDMIDGRMAKARKDLDDAAKSLNDYRSSASKYGDRFSNEKLKELIQEAEKTKAKLKKLEDLKSEKVPYYAFLATVIGEYPLSREYLTELLKFIASNGYIDENGYFAGQPKTQGLYRIEANLGKRAVIIHEGSMKLAFEIMKGQMNHYQALADIKVTNLKEINMLRFIDHGLEEATYSIKALEELNLKGQTSAITSDVNHSVGVKPFDKEESYVGTIFQVIQYLKEYGLFNSDENLLNLEEKYKQGQLKVVDIINLAHKYLDKKYLRQEAERIMGAEEAKKKQLYASVPQEMWNIEIGNFGVMAADAEYLKNVPQYFNETISRFRNLMLLARINAADPKSLKATLNGMYTNAPAYIETPINNAQYKAAELMEEVSRSR